VKLTQLCGGKKAHQQRLRIGLRHSEVDPALRDGAESDLEAAKTYLASLAGVSGDSSILYDSLTQRFWRRKKGTKRITVKRTF